MKPEQREDIIYSKGKKNKIELDEEIMFSMLPSKNGIKVLDIGCGTGEIMAKIRKKGFDVVGIDFSKVAVKKAKQNGLNVLLCDVDNSGLPFKSNSFDVIWAGDIIEHVFDPINLVHEIRRVLKKDGVLLLTTPNDFNMFIRIYVFITGKSPQGMVYKRHGHSKHHTLFSWDLLKYMLKKGKFKIEKFRAVIKLPYISLEKYTKKKLIGVLFGKTFIIKATK